jgi:spore maturation protein CgeB
MSLGRVFVVGNRTGTNVGGAFERALPRLGYEAELIEARLAMQAPMAVRRFNWWLRGRRPTHLRRVSRAILAACEARRPLCLVATGAAPVEAETLKQLAETGIPSHNYLTDDPWNRRHYAPWFLRALSHYAIVWTTRRANISDLEALGCPDVRYLPFGYDPDLHFPAPEAGGSAVAPSDVLFAGGADRDRVPFLGALVRDGIRLALYGDYWGRYAGTRPAYRGYASPEMLRSAVGATKVCICLVRRANRDGQVMRSYEIPAMRGCMLAEDTPEHRTLFGDEGVAVLYFRTKEEMVEKVRWLLRHPAERARLANAAHEIVTKGHHTYQDRLATMLAAVSPGRVAAGKVASVP